MFLKKSRNKNNQPISNSRTSPPSRRLGDDGKQRMKKCLTNNKQKSSLYIFTQENEDKYGNVLVLIVLTVASV